MIHRPFLESDVVNTCQLSCKSCGHVAPFYKKNDYPLDQFKRDVETLATVYRCDTFVMLGGEPLLLRDRLPEYVEAVRDSGICKTLKIVTNGILAPTYKEHLKLFDFISISLYDHEHRERISKWFHEHKSEFDALGIQFYLNPISKFATAFTTERLSDERAELSWQKCGAKKWCHQLYRGRYFLCGPAARFPRVLEEKGIKVDERGCDLYAPELERRLREYLDTKEKLETCRFCEGHLTFHDWKQE